jgi:hypothetical protein
MTKEKTLQELHGAIERLVSVLRLDPSCHWVRAFEDNLEFSRQLLVKGFNDSDASRLSKSIRGVFQGSGSFSNYAPGKYSPEPGRYPPIPGADDFETITERVFDLASLLQEQTGENGKNK